MMALRIENRLSRLKSWGRRHNVPSGTKYKVGTEQLKPEVQVQMDLDLLLTTAIGPRLVDFVILRIHYGIQTTQIRRDGRGGGSRGR